MTAERKSEFIVFTLTLFPLIFYTFLVYYVEDMLDIGLNLLMFSVVLVASCYILRDKIPIIKKTVEVNKLYSDKLKPLKSYKIFIIVMAVVFAVYYNLVNKDIFWIPLCGLGFIYLEDYKKGLKILFSDVFFKIVEYIVYVIIIFYNYNTLLEILLFILFGLEFIYLALWFNETALLYYTRFNSESSEDKTNINEKEDKLENG